MRVTLEHHQRLALAGQHRGLTFSQGDGTTDATMTFSGSPAAINAALDGLRYTPVLGGPAAAALQIISLDQSPGGGQTDTDNLAIAISRRPVAVSDGPYPVNTGATLNVPAATGLLLNDTDSDTPPAQLQAVVVTGPTRGTLNVQPNGAFTYTPTGSGGGTDTFTYRVVDPQGNAATGTATIAITAVACGPRPSVIVTTQVAGGALQATVSAATNAQAPNSGPVDPVWHAQERRGDPERSGGHGRPDGDAAGRRHDPDLHGTARGGWQVDDGAADGGGCAAPGRPSSGPGPCVGTDEAPTSAPGRPLSSPLSCLRAAPPGGYVDVASETKALRRMASSRRRYFWIFPLPVIGNSSTKIARLGILKLASWPRQRAMTSCSVQHRVSPRMMKANGTLGQARVRDADHGDVIDAGIFEQETLDLRRLELRRARRGRVEDVGTGARTGVDARQGCGGGCGQRQQHHDDSGREHLQRVRPGTPPCSRAPHATHPIPNGIGRGGAGAQTGAGHEAIARTSVHPRATPTALPATGRYLILMWRTLPPD